MPAGENAAAIATLMTLMFSLVVMGWALLYRCTDATLVPGDFAVQKCFSFIAKPKKDEPEPESGDKEEESTSLFSGSVNGGSILETVDDEDLSELELDNLAYIGEFNEMSTKLTSEVFTDISAANIYDCARICATNEVQIDEEDEEGECGGFTSEYEDPTPDDQRVMCRLYKKDNLSDTGVKSFATTSFYLKGLDPP